MIWFRNDQKFYVKSDVGYGGSIYKMNYDFDMNAVTQMIVVNICYPSIFASSENDILSTQITINRDRFDIGYVFGGGLNLVR